VKPVAGQGFGLDSSGEGNNFTATNLVATDQMIDTPTNNFATMNPVDLSWAYPAGQPVGPPTLSEGNLKLSHKDGSAGYEQGRGTIAVQSGKWYFEALYLLSGGIYQGVGIATTSTDSIRYWGGNLLTQWQYQSEGATFNNNVQTSTNADSYTTGDIISVAFDCDAGKIWWAKNGTWQGAGSPDPATGADARYDNLATTIASDGNPVAPFSLVYNTSTDWVFNFGSDSSFAGNKTAQGNQDGNSKGDFYYTPPTDYLALCTDNLSAPEIALPGDYFGIAEYSGNSSTNVITTGLPPDFVWLKSTTNTYYNQLYDSVRGVNLALYSNVTDAQYVDVDALMSFDSTGFTLGAEDGANDSAQSYVTWNWKAGGAPTADNSAGAGATPTAGSVKIDGSNLGSALAGTIAATRLSANTTAGFSVVTYTGTGSASTIAHGLSQAPDLVMVKSMLNDTGDGFIVYSSGLPSAGRWVDLSFNAVMPAANSAVWNDTAPTASVFSVGTASGTNTDTYTYIAYCFHNIEGYSKVGSYEGNGNADGTFVYTGFRPAFFIIKNIDSAYSWVMYDNKRNTYNPEENYLYPDDNSMEGVTTSGMTDFVSNGFKFRGTGAAFNGSETFIYIAFAESPFKYSNAR
jgi:hypothetical protein